MHRDLCDGKSGMCPEMDPVDGELLKKYLLDVRFTGRFTRDELEPIIIHERYQK